MNSLPLPRRRALPLQTEISPLHRSIVMFAIALGGFGIGTTEFVSMGLLPLIAADFQMTEEEAGRIIAAYALGVVIGAPVITTLTGRIPRRRLLLILMAFFVLGNALSMLAPSYGLLILARFIAGFPHGAYFSVSGLCAASMAPAGQRGRALALVGIGFSAATIGGVPLAQWLGQVVHWKAAYGVVVTAGVLTLLALWFFMPHMTEMKSTSPATELGALARSQVWLTLAIGTVGFGGMFAVYTYIGWTMTDPTRAAMSASLIPFVLAAYGAGGLVGNLFGGHLADRNLELGIGFVLSCIAITLVCFYYLSAWVAGGMVLFALLGLFGSALVPQLQIRLMDVAGDAQTLAAALNHSALNMANAAGAAVGGALIASGLSYASPALAGAAMAGAALLVWWAAVTTRAKTRAHTL
ncbi:MFS transporter [Corynebacterium epidermidicanis]|uniref:Arabinose efflux permease family protein n=1 Tax=Corynebacterium epidermidicanis TaxID=1050174 RepID=A0A0G3GMR3_9CORY|nr:MFS transporter [Corynebacterium epidermidicanis]AKK02429.1 arabinose efflux permease family protein [Corynebacterium epidermidicanis]